MKITFSEKNLKKIIKDDDYNNRKLVKKYGARRAQLIRLRLDSLKFAETLEDVRHLPGRFHELKENRKGEWSCDLDHPYRLIFIPHESPIPTDANGKYIWVEIIAVDVTEIVDYH
jgi:proteic killer suppression protein